MKANVKRILSILLLTAVLLLVLSAVACDNNVHTVVFYVDGEPYAVYTVKDGGYLEDVPSVPTKEGKTGTWEEVDLDEITSNLKINAIYVDATYKVKFFVEGELYKEIEVKYNSKLTDVPAVPEKAGFLGSWNVMDFSNIDRNINVVAEYEEIAVSVSFVSGEELLYTRYVSVGKGLKDVPDVPSYVGKNLTGRWVNDKGEEADFSVIPENITVYADYFVTVKLENTEKTFATCEMGTVSNSFESGQKDDYDFGGWYFDADFRNEVVFPYVFEENTTIYGRWINNFGDEGFEFSEGAVTAYVGEKTEVVLPYKYTVEGEEVVVTKIADGAFADAEFTKITLPSTLSEIGESAFENCVSLREVVFADGGYVEKIGANAFKNCVSLVSFGFSQYLTEIGEYAFYNCQRVRSYDNFEKTAITEIADGVFYNNLGVRSFVLPRNLQTIGEWAFYGDAQAQFTFDNDNIITEVKREAFKGCTLLSKFYAPQIETINTSAFAECRSLTQLSVPASKEFYSIFGTTPDPYYYEINGYYVPIPLHSVFVVGNNGGEVINNMFNGFYTVKYVEIGQGVKKIAKRAFTLGNRISEGDFKIVFSDTVTQIDEYAFYGRYDLKTLDLPLSLERIEKCAFADLYNLTTVNIGTNSALSYVGKDAFDGTSWYNNYNGVITLGRVALGITEKYLNSIGKVALTADDFNGISIIAPYAFAENNVIKSVYIPNEVYRIYDHAFADCKSLSVAEISTGTKIGYVEGDEEINAIFEGCRSLKKLTISLDVRPEQLFGAKAENGFVAFNGSYIPSTFTDLVLLAGNTDIVEKGVYNGITTVRNLTLSEGIVGINDGAFADCVIREIVFSSTITFIGGIDEDEENFEEYIFEGTFNGVQKISFAENSTLKMIYDRAFENSYLTKLSLPQSVEYIGKYAFANNDGSGFDNVSFGEGENDLFIDDYAFADSKFDSTAKDYIQLFPERLVAIGKYAFANCRGIKGAKLNGRLKQLGEGAFKNSGIKSFDIPENVDYFVDEEVAIAEILAGTPIVELTVRKPIAVESIFGTVPTSLEKVVFYGDIADNAICGLTQILYATIVDAENIGSHAFYGCTGITQIDLPASVKEIGNYAFAECTEMINFVVDVDTELHYIGEYVFQNDKKLYSVFLPTTIQNSFYVGVFSGCQLLKSTTPLPDSLTEIGENTFYNCTQLSSINIPKNIEHIGKKAFYGCASLEIRDTKFDKLVTIEESAFEGCTLFRGINASNLQKVGNNAFYGCENMEIISLVNNSISVITNTCENIETVVISSRSESIHSDMLYGCVNLKNIKICVEDAKINNILSNLTDYAGCHMFVFTSGYKCIAEEILNGVLKDSIYPNPTEIEAEFSYDEKNKTAKIISVGGYTGEVIYFPAYTYNEGVEFTITEIGNSILEGNKTATKIIIPYCIEKIGAYAFYKSNVATVIFEGGSVLTAIDQYAFRDCVNLTTIKLPNSIVDIGVGAFYGSGITEFNVASFSDLVNIGEYAFYNCTNLKSVSINTVTLENIGSYAFGRCGLESVYITNFAIIKVIKAYTFKDCPYLSQENVVLPEGITIEENAFINN